MTAQKQVQVVDLNTQYARLKSEIDPAIQAVIDQGVFIGGETVKRFSKSLATYLDCGHVITCANGTDALQIAFQALDLAIGDEIIVPAFNYVAAAEAAALLHLKPVFVDVNRETFNMDPALIEKAISPKTKVIVPVHLFGQGCDMEAIMSIAEKHKLHVVEDNAQAIGSKCVSGKYAGKRLGTIGNIGTTSFFPSKNLGCMGDGGALMTNDSGLAATIQMLANHGQEVKYKYQKIGVNSRLDTIQAAILEVKLRHLDDLTRRRQTAAAYYDQALSDRTDLSIPSREKSSTHVFHQYTLILESPDARTRLKEKLGGMGIQAMIYYPKSLHLQDAYQYLGYKKGDFPVSEWLSERVLSLPMHSEFNEETLEYVVGTVRGSLLS